MTKDDRARTKNNIDSWTAVIAMEAKFLAERALLDPGLFTDDATASMVEARASLQVAIENAMRKR